VAKVSFWFLKMRSILKRTCKNNFPIFSFNKVFHLKLLGFRFFDQKLSFTPLSFELESTNVSEDSKKMKKKKQTIFYQQFFSLKFFF